MGKCNDQLSSLQLKYYKYIADNPNCHFNDVRGEFHTEKLGAIVYHLIKLKDHGYVSFRKDRKGMRYTITDKPLDEF